ncbi:MAG: hypothetical protein CL678_10720 [Bdellovibrionaceae bacterium]|nr:hypothetical protein [Pseudobdellovibrionaceae bacterium]|tara:strand:+ start:2966 stop:4228 length:1263 start_codon:yes stop_codon:yes gene_type:complete
MSFEERFLELSKLLKETQFIHEMEFLKRYPHPYPDFMIDWLKELDQWDFAQLAEFEFQPHEDLVKNREFKDYLKKIRHLTQINKLKINETSLKKDLTRKMTDKKQHEVKTLKTLISSNHQYKTIIDIGGGAGHLSCAILNNTNLKSICIDQDLKIQSAGKNRIEKWQPDIKNQIHFIEDNFTEKSQMNGYSPESTIILGLHCCGNLSNAVIKFAIKNKIFSLINFGCCYHKLDNEYNISNYAKKEGLHFSTHSLHLATRSSAFVSEKDLKKRFRVKGYRYALHYLLSDRFNLPFYALGNATQADYQGPFCEYVKKYFRSDELKTFSDTELNQYYQQTSVQKKIKFNILADLIRLTLGRVIEIYLLTDRALYLKENGFPAELYEVFDRKISPRNIMILTGLDIESFKQKPSIQFKNTICPS